MKKIIRKYAPHVARHKNYLARVLSYLSIINFIGIFYFGLSNRWWIFWIAPCVFVVLDFLGYLDSRIILSHEQDYLANKNPYLLKLDQKLDLLKEQLDEVNEHVKRCRFDDS